MSDFITDSMGSPDMMMEDSDVALMSNSDLDVEEIIKIDSTESEEFEEETNNPNRISEKEQMKEDVAEMEKKETQCPECGSTRLINDHERGEVVCGNCGLVIDDNLVDMGPEWRAFDHEQRDKRTRVGAPITYTIHDKGLSTMIDWRNKDIYGRDIPARNRAQWYRLRKWQRKIRISGATERNLAFALSELDRDSSRLGLPRSVRESASVVYRNAVENKLIRGRSIEGVVAASLYAACRRCQVPRTLDEIAEVSRVSKKEVGRTYRFLTRELHIRLPPTSPIDYVPRFASELNLSGLVQSKAIEIINQAMENGLTSGRGPTGVAAAALYIASVLLGERKTQRDVADIAGVTEVTIRNRYKELTEQLDMGVAL
jgi:transcription initiation factor TFIIB